MRSGNGRTPVRVEVLGPLCLLVDELPVDVRGPKRRAVLALLALAEGRTVTVDHLLDALWPAEVPESGRQALHSHVSRLRAHLGRATDRLTTLHDGYRLELGADELDLTRARAMLRAARAEAEHDPAGAYARLREAHRLWRGPMLADLADVAPIAVAVEGCAQLHREVTDALVAAAIAAGRAADVVETAGAAVAADPLREPAVLLLMRTLAAAGRAPEALRTGREYRRRLADETGLDPSPALDETERAIAGGTAGPAPPRPAVPAPPATRLFGREGQVAALHRLLAEERLLTVVGPGGVGKTRVALELARRAETATVLLLAPVSEPAAVPSALAAAMNLTVTHSDVLAACIAVLADRPGLVLIDNCEHLLDATRDLVLALLSSCPRLTVLTTSREPLGLAAEHTFRLAPLALPEPHQDPSRSPAVAVFLDRAARVRRGGPAPTELNLVADIVRRLDGMPLAIELAAGRLSSFSLADLHARLDRALDLLGSRSVESRHRTLRATVEWSYQLLGDDERRLFRHLSVFVDGFDLDTVESVAADLGIVDDPGTVLARLVDASMIEATFEGRTRYRMLETLRAFGLDRLVAEGEHEAATRRLLRWAVDLSSWIDTVVTTEREADADAAVRRELGNLREAWRLAREGGSLDEAVAMVVTLYEVWEWRAFPAMWGWAEELERDPALPAHPRVAEVLAVAAASAFLRGDHQLADRRARAGLAVATDVNGSVLCLGSLALAALSRGAYAEVLEHSLAVTDLTPRPYIALSVAALAAAYSGDLDRALALNARMAEIAVSPTSRGFCSYTSGEIARSAGQYEPAQQHHLEAIALARVSGATLLAGVASVGLATALAAGGRVDDALRAYRDVIRYFAAAGNWSYLWMTLRSLAELLRGLGDPDPAAVLEAAADHADNAPGGSPSHPAAPGRAPVLDVAFRAIEQHIAGD